MKNNSLLLAPVVVAICLSVVSWRIQAYLEKVEKSEYQQYLSTVLEITRQAIHSWSDENEAAAQIWADTPEIRQITKQLIAAVEANENLIKLPLQQQLRHLLEPALKREHVKGYFIIGPGNLNLSSARDENIGVENLMVEQAGLISKWWAGETGMSVPQRSDVALIDTHGQLVHGAPTMFVGAPIHDEAGTVIAILTFRLDPAGDFTELFKRGRIGATGETYAFNRNGLLISDSRFDQQLIDAGLLGAGERAMLNFNLSNLSGQPDSESFSMAQHAIRSGVGANLDGYRGYRGAQVIGVWHWDDGLSFGIASEIERSESYEDLLALRYLTASFTLLAILLIAVLVAVYQTKTKRVERSEILHRTVLESIIDGIVNVDEDGIIESVNPAMEKLFGYRADELVGNNVSKIIPEKYREQHARLMGNLRKNNGSGSRDFLNVMREIEGRHKNGDVFPIDIAISEIIVNGRRLFNCVLRDISNRKAAEKLIRENEERFRVAFESAAQGLCMVSPAGEFLKLNEALCGILGYTEQELLQKNFRDITYADDLDGSVQQVKELLSGERKYFRQEKRYIHKNGHLVWALVVSSLVRDAKGMPGYFITQILDLTERKQTEQALEQARKEIDEAREKLTLLSRRQVLGEMVTSIAHELNQPLAAIEMYAVAGLVGNEKETLNAEKLKTILEKINNQSKRASDVIKRIRSMSRPRDTVVEDVDFAELVSNVEKLVEVNLGMGGCRLELVVAKDVCLVRCDPVLLQQVMVNLILNAVDAMAAKTTSEDKVIAVNAFSGDGPCLNIEVIDRGEGVNAEAENNLFDPFFTTKENGMGIGLSISKNIVESYGGELWYSPNPEGGAVFHVSLPCGMRAESDNGGGHE